MDIGTFVIVRTYSAGVHVGTLAKRDGKEVMLNDARRIWSWKGAYTLHEIALAGVGRGSRVSAAVPTVLLTEAMAQSSGWLLLGILKMQRDLAQFPMLSAHNQSKTADPALCAGAATNALALAASSAGTIPSTFFWFGQISTQTLNSMIVPSHAPMPMTSDDR